MSERARWVRHVGDAAALLTVVTALLLPDRLTVTDFGSFVAVPLELILATMVLLVLPAAARVPVATGLGILLGALTVLKIVDACFYATLSRPFDLVLDWRLAGGAWQLLAASLGVGLALVVVSGAVLVAVGVPVVIVWAVRQLTRLLADHTSTASVLVVAAAAFWLGCAATGMVVAAPYPVATHASTTKIVDEIVRVRDGRLDQQRLAAEAAVDRFRDVPSNQLLTALRGKQVVLVFVESYGRIALDDPAIAPQVGTTLAAADRALADSGLQARSGFLTSPTAGGGSWLAHSTLLSGLWIDNQRRYLTLMASERLSLTSTFQRAGWHTIGLMPGVTTAWPEGAFYHFDEIHDSYDLGYTGPAYGWSRVPDQYTLAQLERLTAPAAHRKPTMTVVPLVTSHAPWSPVPPMVDWSRLGDSGVYGSSTAEAEPPEAILTREPGRVRADYARSICYSVASVIDYATRQVDDDLVLIMLGDHQPAPVVTGPNANRDIPITVMTDDPAVLERIADWGWSPSVRPGADAPVWPMDAFRDRFLTDFSIGG